MNNIYVCSYVWEYFKDFILAENVIDRLAFDNWIVTSQDAGV